MKAGLNTAGEISFKKGCKSERQNESAKNEKIESDKNQSAEKPTAPKRANQKQFFFKKQF